MSYNMTHYVEPSFTRRKLQRPDENGQMWNGFQSFDPDCCIREQEHLVSRDEEAQVNLLGLYWKACTVGKDFPNSDQHWRKLSIRRGAPFNESIFTRFENISLWKKSCRALSTCEFPGSSQFERSLYGTFGGLPGQSVLSASNVAECMWAYMKCLVESCFEQFYFNEIKQDPIFADLCLGEIPPFDQEEELKQCFAQLRKSLYSNGMFRVQLWFPTAILVTHLVEAVICGSSDPDELSNAIPESVSPECLLSLCFCSRMLCLVEKRDMVGHLGLSVQIFTLLVDHLKEKDFFKLFWPLMTIEDQVTSVCRLFVTQECVDILPNFIFELHAENEGFLLGDRMRSVCEKLIEILEAEIGDEKNSQLLANFMNCFSTYDDREYDVLEPFLMLCSRLASNPISHEVGFKLLSKIKDPLAKLPQLYFFKSLFFGIHFLHELVKYRQEFSEIFHVSDPDLRQSFKSQKELTKAEVEEFLIMTQIEGMPEFSQSFLPKVLIQILYLCLESAEYDLGCLVGPYVSSEESKVYTIFSKQELIEFVHVSTKLHCSLHASRLRE
eukprot:TRINITY_DN11265_c0_g1_i1.p1 TRINITY_DN11265_c0_g1~~TRINITY_DN11265_c0_g1_i1.p1  ORF type:complete len:601 (+),score=129.80 TRINITY_DN11265_c0_g1_i1:146-1804(+)